MCVCTHKTHISWFSLACCMSCMLYSRRASCHVGQPRPFLWASCDRQVHFNQTRWIHYTCFIPSPPHFLFFSRHSPLPCILLNVSQRTKNEGDLGTRLGALDTKPAKNRATTFVMVVQLFSFLSTLHYVVKVTQLGGGEGQPVAQY